MNQQRRNRWIGWACAALVAAMVGLSFASVPLYSLFCKVTGFGGTTQTAGSSPPRVVDRTLTVLFTADTNTGLPWDFHPEVSQMQVKLGEPATVKFRARNRAAVPLVGQATYNVQPDKSGIYFVKTQCFCFTEQVLAAGQEVEMPVYFYVDPSLDDDEQAKDVTTITLSYTFFLAADQSAARKLAGHEAKQAAATPPSLVPIALTGTPDAPTRTN